MRTLDEQIRILNSLINQAKKQGSAGETEWVEFKSNIGYTKSSITYEGVGKYISGLANSACVKDKPYAYLVLGIEDITWDIVGTNLNMKTAKFKGQDFELWLRKILSPSVNFEIEEFDYENKHIVIFIIPSAISEPVSFKGENFVRIGSNLTLLDGFKEYIQKIYNSRNDWSAEIVEDATIEDLDESAIAKARSLYSNKHEYLRDEVAQWDDITFLNKAKITKKGKITNAAILLLGKPESEVLISPAIAKIRWILKDSNDSERDYLIKSCPFINSVEEIYSKIRNLKYRYINTAFNSLFPEEIDTYDPYVIREAINNCIAHQDYRMSGMINVVEYDDKLIFTNKGNFIPMNIQAVLETNAPEEQYRNPFLAQAMVELKMVDTIGSGIRKMFKSQLKRLFPMPDYDFSNNKVSVAITGKIIDDNYSTMLSTHSDLALYQIEMLNRVLLKKTLTDEEIAHLRSKKLIEGRKPNVYIARSIAEIADKKVEYTKNKGFNDDYYKDLILKALAQHKKLSRKEIDNLLKEKLPDILSEKQKYNKIKNLLSGLRIKNKIKATTGKSWLLDEP